MGSHLCSDFSLWHSGFNPSRDFNPGMNLKFTPYSPTMNVSGMKIGPTTVWTRVDPGLAGAPPSIPSDPLIP
jgi:hypothetical protein